MNTGKSVDKLNGNLNIVGNNIIKYRNKYGLSRQDLSNQLMILGIDISAQLIYSIEAGTRTVVDYELCAIAKVFNTTADMLMKDFKEYLDNM